MLKRSLAMIAASLTLAFAAPAHAEDHSLARVIQAKVLRVGVAINTPWVFKKSDGSWAGYDVDLTTAMARDLGATPQFVEVPFGEIIPRLTRGDFDLIAMGLAITPERARDVVFSAPTGVSVIRAVVAIGTSSAEATIHAPEVRIAVLRGSTDAAAAAAAYPKATLVSFPNAGDAVAALLTGQTQALVATSPVPRMTTRMADAWVRLIEAPIARTAEAFALRPEDERLRAYADNWIAARLTDGTIENTRQYWFFGFKWLSDMEPKREAASK